MASINDCSTITSCESMVVTPSKSHIFYHFSNMPSVRDDRISATLRDELRRVVSLQCLDIVYRRDSMTVAQQRNAMFDLFHGCEGSNTISYCYQLCNAESPFDKMFEDRLDPILNRQQDSESNRKQIKVLYSRNNNPMYLGTHINVKVLTEKTFKQRTLLQGRSVLELAKKALSTSWQPSGFIRRLASS